MVECSERNTGSYPCPCWGVCAPGTDSGFWCEGLRFLGFFLSFESTATGGEVTLGPGTGSPRRQGTEAR